MLSILLSTVCAIAPTLSEIILANRDITRDYMLFGFRPQLRRRSRKPVPATINDIHIPPGTATDAADDFEIKGYTGFSLGNKIPKLRRVTCHPRILP